MKIAAEEPKTAESRSDAQAKPDPKAKPDPESRSWKQKSANSAAEGLLRD